MFCKWAGNDATSVNRYGQDFENLWKSRGVWEDDEDDVGNV